MICKDCEHFLHREVARYKISPYKGVCLLDTQLMDDDLGVTGCSQYSKNKSLANEKSIAVKTPAILIDELFTILHKCWDAQEVVMDKHNILSDDVIAKASIDAQELNAKRNRVIRALDEILGYKDVTLTEKTYDKEK